MSPSRAADFMTCPLLYRFRVIDRLPEPPTTATARGTLVHAALERLFDLPAAERIPEAARTLLAAEWDRLAAEEPDLVALFENEAERAEWLASATAIVDAYFTLEDPRRLEPAEREAYVETTLSPGCGCAATSTGWTWRRAARSGSWTTRPARAPREAYEASALFQMKFYALVIWRLRGQVPRLLQLMYLAEGEVLRYSPTSPTCSPPSARSRRCGRPSSGPGTPVTGGRGRAGCATGATTQALCPEFGGTPPPLPESAPASRCCPPIRRPSPSPRCPSRRRPQRELLDGSGWLEAAGVICSGCCGVFSGKWQATWWPGTSSASGGSCVAADLLRLPAPGVEAARRAAG